MRLNELKDIPGASKNRIRVGRGIGSGRGKTGGRGVKGQKSREGVSINGFEGGQMPLHRRLPKRGFSPINRKALNEVNLGRLQIAVDAGKIDASQPVDVAILSAAGVVRRELDGLRILGNGELKAKLTIKADHVSASAKAAIEKAGGSVDLIVPKVLPADVAKRDKTAAKKAAKAKAKGKG